MIDLKSNRLKLIKKERIRRRSEYDRIYKDGIRYRSRHFNIIISPNDNGFSRFGVTVSKKTGLAVKRNRAKRIVREIFRKNKLLFQPYRDYIFVVKKGAHELTYQEFLQELKLLLALSSR